MPYRCSACGAQFVNMEQLANHKRFHAGPSASSEPGVTCLGCGRKIPLQESQKNYTGPLTCPNCHRTMKVVIDNGEVAVARLG